MSEPFTDEERTEKARYATEHINSYYRFEEGFHCLDILRWDATIRAVEAERDRYAALWVAAIGLLGQQRSLEILERYREDS